MRVRTALSGEQAPLEALQRRASLIWEESREALLAHPDAIEIPLAQLEAGAVRVAEIEGAVVGFSAVIACDGWIELDGLFVEPEHMRKGIGRRLVEDVVANARERGERAIEVTANPRALRFYLSVGFVEVGTVETRFGPGVRMRLSMELV